MALFKRDKPKIKVQSSKKDGYSGWLKCTHCKELIHRNELEKNLNCCPKCDNHYRLNAAERIRTLVDPDSFEELFSQLRAVDALEFVDLQAYPERLESAQEQAQQHEAIVTGIGTVKQQATALAVMDFTFMGGSMGSVVGEKLTRLIEHAIDAELPLITIASSGGARMQESILSLMQMAKTAAALGKLNEAGLPYISVMTNPTSGGVTASFASLGDIIIAEPGALICFAGPRVIEQTIREKLPPGAQRAEFLLEHGMIDRVVPRQELRETLGELLEFLTQNARDCHLRPVNNLGEIDGQLPSKLQELMRFREEEEKRTEAPSRRVQLT